SDGEVEKAMIGLDTAVPDDRLAAAGAHLAAHLVNGPLDPAALAGVPPPTDEPTCRVVSAASDALAGTAAGADEGTQVAVGGTAPMAATSAPIAPARRVLALLEQQYVVVSLPRQAIHDDRLSVAVGAEHGVALLAECSLVVAPFEIDDS